MIIIQTLLIANECVMRHSQSSKADDFIPSSALADILTVPEATLRYWLIAIHTIAVIYHRFKGDGVWTPMVPFWREKLKTTRN